MIFTSKEVQENHEMCKGVEQYVDAYIAYAKHKEIVENLTNECNAVKQMLAEATNVLLISKLKPVNASKEEGQ